MKTLKKLFQHSIALCAVASLIMSNAGDAEDNQTNHASQLVYGQLTNGIRAEIKIDWITNNYKSPVITTLIADTDADKIFGEENLGTNWMEALMQNLQSNHWPYYQPTNSFCGPIELVDVMGRKMPLVKPVVSSPESYPATYSLSAEWSRHLPKEPTVSLSPLIFPLPLAAPVSKIIEFRLEDYFDIKEPGDYQLTVWPKIYKRESTNDDLCQRIDLPPVTVTIKWDGATSK